MSRSIRIEPRVQLDPGAMDLVDPEGEGIVVGLRRASLLAGEVLDQGSKADA
jgi:hypothetical protein